MPPFGQRARLAQIALAVVVAFPLAARDWSEPPRVFDPLLSVESPGSEAGGLAILEYNYQAFHSSYDDLFQINALSALSFAALGANPGVLEGVGIGVAYGSYLMNGAVQEGDSPGSRLQWMMNAVQLEYGVFVALRMARLARLDLVGEYSRTSQHPFRDQYSQVASDVLRGGALARARLPLDVESLLSLRVAYVDLFDFWESPLPKPRACCLLTPELWLLRPLGSLGRGRARVGVAAAGEGHLDWVFLRRGGQGVNASFRAGARLTLKSLSLDLYLDGFASDDTEIRDDRTTPAGLLGWGVRLAGGSPDAAPPAARGQTRR